MKFDTEAPEYARRFRPSAWKIAKWAILLLFIAGFAFLSSWIHSHYTNNFAENQVTGGASSAAASATAAPPPPSAPARNIPAGLPAESRFQQVAETDTLILSADPDTGHFEVKDKRNGNIWYSFPDPDQFHDLTVSDSGMKNMSSPFMFDTVDFNANTMIPSTGSFFLNKGEVTAWKPVDEGYEVGYQIPSIQLAFTVQVTIDGDTVTTRLIDSSIREGRLKLVDLRLFPFFGAEQSAGQDGYLFAPDGPGALADFRNNRATRDMYSERVFGHDIAFDKGKMDYAEQPVRMPVFGLKSGDKAFIAVADEGAAYDNIVVSPSGSYSEYNWATAQANFRNAYFQITNGTQGFTTYTKERFRSDHSTHYMILPANQADYVGMAARYRQYLIEHDHLHRTDSGGKPIPLFLDMIGGDREPGLLGSRYVTATTTSEAAAIVDSLYGQGVRNMNVSYIGWQKGGYSNYGSFFPADSRLGGNQGLQRLIDTVHTMDFPFSLQVDYSSNDTGRGGFHTARDAIRDYAQKTIDTLMSSRFIATLFPQDMQSVAASGADGIQLSGSIAEYLDTDYNDRNSVTRADTMQVNENLLSGAAKALTQTQAVNPNFYLLEFASALRDLPSEGSHYTLFDDTVPFAQIALHGLIPYTSQYANERDRRAEEFLRDIEYGDAPSWILMYEDPERVKESYQFGRLFSPGFQDWKDDAVSEYQRYDQALSAVQDQFITGHRQIAPGVMETVYENGRRILVNYNDAPYTTQEGVTINAKDFIVIDGKGEGK